jgi:ferredoxin
MKGLIVEKDQLPKLVSDLIGRYRVFAPVNRDGVTCFDEVTSADEFNLTFQSKISSKEVLFPRCEILFTYELSNGNVELRENPVKDEKVVLFGLPPCEARGFALIDKTFASGEVQDISYLKRRGNTIILGKSCEHPRSTCFCTSVGGSPFGREGLDLLLQDLGRRYLLEATSEKGEKLVAEIQGYSEATQDDFEEARRVEKVAEESIRTKLSLQGVEEKLGKMFDDPFWDVVYQKCVGCGVCTFLCPTCYCFDIVDESSGSRGERIRVWDSCQFTFFTMQGSGENPRPTGKERMRQRVMHKFNYYPKTYGVIACVGCGRCVQECPVNLDIREILTKISVK